MKTEQAGVGSPSLSKAEIAYRWIRERVADQTYQPGHKLVLAQIALELDTSVVPVREAIRRLEADGLVTFERNVGARVAMVDQGSYAQSMETVAILEAAAVAQAQSRLGADDLDAAERINDRMRALLDDFEPAEFTRLNHKFHETLYRRCPNEAVHPRRTRMGPAQPPAGFDVLLRPRAGAGIGGGALAHRRPHSGPRLGAGDRESRA